MTATDTARAIIEAGDVEAVAPVVEEDRIAAAALVRWQRQATGEWKQDGEEAWQFFHEGFSRGIRQGIWDDHPVVQAFARHRIAATLPAAKKG